MKKVKVFVYGTLRKGYGNHVFLEGSKFLGKAKTKEKYTMYARGIPFVSHEPMVEITGEVYEVDDFTLNRLDTLEGHPNWYIREKVPVILEDGTEVEAWLYFNDVEGGDIVPTGDYEDYERRYALWA